MTTTAPIRAVSIVAVVLTLLVTPACYTLFYHPRIARLRYARPERARCDACHTSRQVARWTYGADSSDRRGPWDDYYDRPGRFNRIVPLDSTHTSPRQNPGSASLSAPGFGLR